MAHFYCINMIAPLVPVLVLVLSLFFSLSFLYSFFAFLLRRRLLLLHFLLYHSINSDELSARLIIRLPLSVIIPTRCPLTVYLLRVVSQPKFPFSAALGKPWDAW